MAARKQTKLPLLRSESAADFLALRTGLHQEIQPKGVIEEIYLEDGAWLIWDLQRYAYSGSACSTADCRKRSGRS